MVKDLGILSYKREDALCFLTILISFASFLNIFLKCSTSEGAVYPLKGGSFSPSSEMRIVSLAPSITETLYFLGLLPNIKGVTRYDDFPEEIKTKEVVGGYLDIDVEKILKISPDVVLCEPNAGIKSSIEIISKKGIPVYVVDIKSVYDILDAIEKLGILFDRKKESLDLLNLLLNQYLRLQRYPIKKLYSGLIILNENPLMIAGSNSFVGELLNISGITNAYLGSQKYPVVDIEILKKMKIDVIINVSESVMSGSKTKSKITSLPLKHISPNGVDFYNISNPVFIRPSPRFMEALMILCSIISQSFCF